MEGAADVVGAADAPSVAVADAASAVDEASVEALGREASAGEALAEDSAGATADIGADSAGATVTAVMATGRGDLDLATTALLPITTLIAIQDMALATIHLRTMADIMAALVLPLA